MTRWILIAALVAGCAKKQEAQPAQGSAAVPVMSATEVQRSRDACSTYVERACACAKTVAAAKEKCDSAQALPDAVRIALEVAANPDTAREDVISSQASVRKTAKNCIEETAKLATLGCPP